MTEGVKVRRPRALWEHPETSWQIALALPVSIGLHVAIVVIMFLQSLFAWKAPLPPPSYEVMLVGPIKKGTPGGGAKASPPGADAVNEKVDVAPAVKSDELAIPMSTPKTTKPGAIPDPKAAKADALARLQKEAALKRMQELQAKSAIPAATPGGNGAEPIPQAAAVSGGSGEGTGNGGSEFGVDWSTLSGSATYEQQITAIAYHEFVPSMGSEKTLIQCVVRVLIGFDGTITATTIEQSSGNPAFDSSALVTFKKIGKFPPPPIELKPYLSKKGLPMRFNSQTASR